MINQIKTFTLIGLGIFAIFPGSIRGQESMVTHFFNDPWDYTSPQESTESEIGLALLDLINNATHTIEFAAYGFRHQDEIIHALSRAERRGVRVRGVIDADVNGENYYMDINAFKSRIHNVRSDAQSDVRQLESDEATFPPYWPKPPGFLGPASCVGYTIGGNKALIGVQASREKIEAVGEIMHNKFFIIDNKYVWTGSCNLSDSGTGGYNANTASVILDSKLARWYLDEFAQMFTEDHFHNEKNSPREFDHWIDGVRVQAFSSPKSRTISRAILPLIRESKSEIDVAVFFLTSKNITAELIRAKERGVRVRVILDATGTKNEYTKFQFLRAAGIPVKIENWGGKMHCKAAQIDREIFISGSMNWTSAGEYQNDENTLVFHDESSAIQFRQRFDSWWTSIDDTWLQNRPDPESLQSGSSCYDGVDNDFDGLADGQDLGCSKSPPPLPPLCPLKWVPLEEGNNLIKGNINSKGKRYYFTPSMYYYPKTIIDKGKGERWFGSPEDAESFGWSRPPGN